MAEEPIEKFRLTEISVEAVENRKSGAREILMTLMFEPEQGGHTQATVASMSPEAARKTAKRLLEAVEIADPASRWN